MIGFRELINNHRLNDEDILFTLGHLNKVSPQDKISRGGFSGINPVSVKTRFNYLSQA